MVIAFRVVLTRIPTGNPVACQMELYCYVFARSLIWYNGGYGSASIISVEKRNYDSLERIREKLDDNQPPE